MAIHYLKRYAQRVVDNGYSICFIRPGEKRPFGKEWQTKTHGPKRIAAMLEAGRGHFGVGVKTGHTIGVDIDCYDKAVVKKMVKACEDLLGKTLRRTGLPPKTLLVYRTDKPFTKVQSKTWIDDEGRAVKLEVLGDGQQFVAFHTHPDTEEPYEWLDGESVLDVPQDQLEMIEQDDALELAAEFDRLANQAGWTQKRGTDLALRSPGGERASDPFLTDKSPVELTADEVIAKLMMVPGAEDYDVWRQIGMALYHQSSGDQWGLDAWHQWSSEAHNYDMDVLDAKWPTFEIEGKGREPVTARLILKLAKEEEDRVASETFDAIRREVRECEDERDFNMVMEKIRHVAFTPIARESLVQNLRAAIKSKTDSVMPIGLIRRMTNFENPENRSKPAWLRDWFYIQQDDTFYNSKTRQVMTTKGFDMTFNRFLLTKKDIIDGITVPESSATNVAVNRFQIPSVANKMYAPLEDERFEANGLAFVNSYSGATVPEMPDTLTPKQKRICDRVKEHMVHLCSVGRDREILLSWFAYIVRTGGKVNWAPVLQGVENDGKSFFGRVMVAVLGGDNVNAINGSDLAETYTSWAEGSQFCMIEEVRLHGQDRFAVINKLKPYITNDMVSIRRMRTDSYKVINTVNYFLTTNHKDGVPVNDSSSRYFPIFSRFQTKAALDKFNRANPDYYKKLHEVLEHPGALRRWFHDYPLHPEFDPVERATESASLKEMRFLNQSDEEESLIVILDREEPGLTRQLLDSAALADAMADSGLVAPYGLAWKRMLSENGFSYLGAVKIDGKTKKFWSQEPDRFNRSGRLDTKAIREHLDPI